MIPTRRLGSLSAIARMRLRSALGVVAVLAVLLSVLVPVAKRRFFPKTWNTWIVKTVRRPDGSLVRLRIRRHPDRDEVHPEVIPAEARPGGVAARPGPARP